jgi:hypothetical protein
MRYVCPVCGKDLRQAVLLLGVDWDEVWRFHKSCHLEEFALKAEEVLSCFALPKGLVKSHTISAKKVNELAQLSEEARKLCLPVQS